MPKVIAVELPDEVVERIDRLVRDGVYPDEAVALRKVVVSFFEKRTVEEERELLTPELEQLAKQRQMEINRRAARQLAPESKTKALRLVGLVADGDIPPDASENFRQRLYRTQGEGR